MTPSELLARLTSSELTEMMAFDLISPIGGDRLDILAAQICQTLDRCLIARKKGEKAPPLEDFILRYGPKAVKSEKAEPKKRQTAREQLKMVELLNEMFGGKDLRSGQRS